MCSPSAAAATFNEKHTLMGLDQEQVRGLNGKDLTELSIEIKVLEKQDPDKDDRSARSKFAGRGRNALQNISVVRRKLLL
jgi:hypothetical protein